MRSNEYTLIEFLTQFLYFSITMATGTIKFFNTTKWFGFITPDEGEKDIFVHMSGLKEGVRLNEGDKVQYDTEESPKGDQAINVETI